MPNPPPGPAAAALKPSEVVAGRYRIVSVLCPPGADSAFATYEAVTAGALAVTLRLLTAPGSGLGPYELRDEDKAYLARQAVLLGRVQHPAVAQTYELGPYGDRAVLLAREPVEQQGQTLRELLAARGGPLAESEAIKLCAQIGEALEAAHQQGACHLNLTPSCVYVISDGPEVRVKVADFGLLPPSWAAQLGEPGYLAPEQLGGPVGGTTDAQLGDRRTDQFALAVILYEMLAGQPAFIAAANEDRQVVLGRVGNEDPLPLSQSRPVEQALARALSRSRGVRFPSVRDFLRALGVDVSRWPASLPYIKAAELAPPDRSPRLLLPMAAGAVFALLGLGAVVAFRQLTEPRGRPALPDLRAPASRAAASDERPASSGTDGLPAADLLAQADGGPDDADRADLPGPGELQDLQSSGERSAEDLAAPGPRRPGPPVRPPVTPGTAPPAVAAGGGGGPLKLAFSGPEVEALTEAQRSDLTSCVKMISPRLPFNILLQNINGILYVDTNRTSPELSTSQDFRDCLKQRVKGKIVPKVLNITKTSKGKAAP